MDLKKMFDTASAIASNLGKTGSVPGADKVAGAVGQVKEMVGKAQGAVGQVKAKADSLGLGDEFEKIANIAEQKTGLDLDGDGDSGVANKHS